MKLAVLFWLFFQVPDLPEPREPFVLVLEIKADKEKIIIEKEDYE